MPRRIPRPTGSPGVGGGPRASSRRCLRRSRPALRCSPRSGRPRTRGSCRSSAAARASLGRSPALEPLKKSAFPYLPAVDQEAIPIEPPFPLPERSDARAAAHVKGVRRDETTRARRRLECGDEALVGFRNDAVALRPSVGPRGEGVCSAPARLVRGGDRRWKPFRSSTATRTLTQDKSTPTSTRSFRPRVERRRSRACEQRDPTERSGSL